MKLATPWLAFSFTTLLLLPSFAIASETEARGSESRIVSEPNPVTRSRAAQELGLMRLRIHPGRCALSFDWLRDAAGSGDLQAKVELALVLADPTSATVDPQEARRLVLSAAYDDHDFAQTTLGVFYQHAIGGEQNFERARHWFEKAVAQGEVIAIQFLAQLYLNGSGGPSRPNAALRLLRESANHGVAQSQYYLGRYFRQERTDSINLPAGETDLVQAYKWSSLAVKSGGDFFTDMGAKIALKGIAEDATEEQVSEAERLVAAFVSRAWDSTWWDLACAEQAEHQG